MSDADFYKRLAGYHVNRKKPRLSPFTYEVKLPKKYYIKSGEEEINYDGMCFTKADGRFIIEKIKGQPGSYWISRTGNTGEDRMLFSYEAIKIRFGQGKWSLKTNGMKLSIGKDPQEYSVFKHDGYTTETTIKKDGTEDSFISSIKNLREQILCGAWKFLGYKEIDSVVL
jgi:hypothetical protein